MHLPKYDVISTVGVLREAQTAYSSGAPESTPGSLVGSMLFICFQFLVSCLCCFCLVLAVLRSLSVLSISLCLEYHIGISVDFTNKIMSCKIILTAWCRKVDSGEKGRIFHDKYVTYFGQILHVLRSLYLIFTSILVILMFHPVLCNST